MCGKEPDNLAPMTKHELQEIVKTGSIKDKARLAGTLGDLLLGPENKPGTRELSLFFDIVRSIINDVEMQVRRKLSEQLAGRTDPPHDLIVMLANDIIEVSFPVLAKSTVLQDDDLIALIAERTTEYRQAIAGRAAVPESVSRAIVSTGDVSAVFTLLRNEGAAIDPNTLSTLVDASSNETDYQELLVSRHDLPEALATRLYDQVSDALRSYITETFPSIDGGGLDDTMPDAVERALAEDRHLKTPQASSLDWEEAQLPAALIHALETDDILLFEDLFQQLTALSAPDAARALYDLGVEGLAITCKAVELDRKAFSKVFCHLRGRRPFTAFKESAQYDKGMAYFDNVESASAKSILEEWRASSSAPSK